MSPHFFMSSILNLLLFTSFLSFANLVGSMNPNFEACEPTTCGNGPNISYPFYIEGRQEPYCGYPGFNLLCNPDGFPSLNISNTPYIVREISYLNYSLRVSNSEFSNDCISISPAKNLTLDSERFNFPPNQKEVLLFFNCDMPQELRQDRVGCWAENRTRSVLGLAIDDEEKKFRYAASSCRGGEMRTMVEEEEYRREGIGEAVKRGFVLNWTATECDECARSGGRCGFDWDSYSFRCYCRDNGDELLKCPGANPRILKLGLGLGLGLATFVMLLILVFFVRKISPTTSVLFWRRNHLTHQVIEAFLKKHGPLPTRRYTYSEIEKFTNCFRIKLGQGGYGSVYKGKLQDGRLIAVKLLTELKGTGEEFINEVASISMTSHVNIVSLLGFCFQGSKRALVYEFMPNGSLEKFIYENNANMIFLQLNCKTLFDIAIGVARGLEYLHRGCNTRILHFDIKPHNILLDEDFHPKISDFGLAKICPRKESIVSLLGARGTAGYIAPEVISRNFGEVSHKSDVYSYGMMVLEMVGGKRNIEVEVDCASEIYFPHWIYKRLELNQELGLRCIKNEIDVEKMKKMTLVSLWCIQTNPLIRPSMNKVVEMLEGSLESLQLPPKPYLSSPSRSPVHYSTQT